MTDQSLGLNDALAFDEMIVESETSFEEPITIKRFSSVPAGPGARGTPQAPQFTLIASTALVVSQDVAASLFKAGVLEVGDLVLEMRYRLNEGSMNVGGAAMADRVIWRGAEYRMVQRTQPERVGGDDVFYHVLLRRTNAAADTAGA